MFNNEIVDFPDELNIFGNEGLFLLCYSNHCAQNRNPMDPDTWTVSQGLFMSDVSLRIKRKMWKYYLLRVDSDFATIETPWE